MVVIKGLSTSKSKVSGERGTRKNDGVRSFKVYTENDKAKICCPGPVIAEPKRKSVPVKAETGHIHTTCVKGGLNKLEKNQGKNINSIQTKVGRKVLADISNFRGNLQKNETLAGSRSGALVGTRGRKASSSSSKLLAGNLNGSQSQAVSGYRTLGRVGNKDLKVFNDNSRTRSKGQETVGGVGRESARNFRPPTRKSLPVFKHVDKVDKCDLKKGMENNLKGKEKSGFPVKPKVGTKVVQQVSNTRNHLWKNRVSDGFIKLASEGHPTGDTHRLCGRSTKPIVKTTIGIPKAQRVSRRTSVLRKSTFGTSISSKRKEAMSRSTLAKHTSSVSCEQLAQNCFASDCNSNFDASTSHLTSKERSTTTAAETSLAKGRSDRRKSYTSLLIARSELLKEHGNLTKQEFLPNIYDVCNHLEVAEYIDEIYQHYWVTEAINPSLKNYMEIQADITPQMRGILINWLIEVHLKFDLMQETLYLMVTVLDYYLSLVSIKKNEMQLVGLTALLLASKYEDFWHPRVMELISISAEVYTRDQMLGMETAILKKLNFRLNLPTPYVFMLRFLRAAQADKKLEKLSFFLIELCLVEYDALHFKPSLLCASAIYVARCTLHMAPAWTPLLLKHSHYEESQIRYCAEMILRFHQAARRTVLKVTHEKFTSADNCRVATLKPLDRLPTQ